MNTQHLNISFRSFTKSRPYYRTSRKHAETRRSTSSSTSSCRPKAAHLTWRLTLPRKCEIWIANRSVDSSRISYALHDNDSLPLSFPLNLRLSFSPLDHSLYSSPFRALSEFNGFNVTSFSLSRFTVLLPSPCICALSLAFTFTPCIIMISVLHSHFFLLFSTFSDILRASNVKM